MVWRVRWTRGKVCAASWLNERTMGKLGKRKHWIIVYIASTLIFIYAIYTIIKCCRCPSCNKVIFFGLLAAKTCPRCKRSLTTGQKVKKSKAAKY